MSNLIALERFATISHQHQSSSFNRFPGLLFYLLYFQPKTELTNPKKGQPLTLWWGGRLIGIDTSATLTCCWTAAAIWELATAAWTAAAAEDAACWEIAIDFGLIWSIWFNPYWGWPILGFGWTWLIDSGCGEILGEVFLANFGLVGGR